MAAHWTTRINKYLRGQGFKYSYGDIRVVKGSSAEPYEKGYITHMGEIWLQANFPLQYVKFLTYLVNNTHQWNDKGYLDVGPFQEMDEVFHNMASTIQKSGLMLVSPITNLKDASKAILNPNTKVGSKKYLKKSSSGY